MSAERLAAEHEERRIRNLAIVAQTAERKRGSSYPPDRNIDALPSVTLVKASSIKAERIRWLWPGWLARGKLHVMAGAPGLGKTTIALGLAAIITRGGQWPDGTTVPCGRVLLWSGEDAAADTLIPRLLAAGADLDRVHIVEGTSDSKGARAFDPATDLSALQICASQLDDVALLIADPIVSAVMGDSHKNTEVRRAMQPLVDLGHALDCAVLGISHFSKGTAGRDPVERVSGSIAFAAVARVVIAVARTVSAEGEAPRHIMARAKSNIGPDHGGFEYRVEQAQLKEEGFAASRVVFTQPVQGSARELLALAETQDSGDKPQSEEAEEWLCELLADGPVAAKEVKKQAAEAGISCKALRKAREKVAAKPRREGGLGEAGAWFWQLKRPAVS